MTESNDPVVPALLRQQMLSLFRQYGFRTVVNAAGQALQSLADAGQTLPYAGPDDADHVNLPELRLAAANLLRPGLF